MRNIVITFGIICLCSLVLLQMGKVALIKNAVPAEILIGCFSAVFLIAGILIARRQPQASASPQQQAPAQQPATTSATYIDYDKLNSLGISKREYEILKEIALGLSNTEIAEKIFLSESTVKTHVSNLLLKLNARRRTEAVRIAKEMNII